MKYILLLFASILFCNFCQSQDAGDMGASPDGMKEDTAKITALLKHSHEFTYTDPLTAMHYAEEAMLLSKQLKDKSGVMKSTIALGFSFFVTGNYSKALKLSFEALKQAEELKDEWEKGAASNLIGNVYMRQGKHSLAAEYFNRAKDIYEKIQDHSRVNLILSNLGRTYLNWQKTDSALHYLQAAFLISVKIKESNPFLYSPFGDLYMQLKKPSLALEYYREGLQIALARKNDRALCIIYVSLADYYNRLNQSDTSIFYGRLAYRIAENKFLQQQEQASRILSEAFQKKNTSDSSLKYLSSALAIKDSLGSSRDESEIQNLVFEDKLKRIQKQEEEEEAQTRRAHRLQYAGIGAGMIIFLLLYLLLSNSPFAKDGLIKFLGILLLLIVFEFINLLIHPSLGNLTNHSPLLMLMVLVAVAALLIPLHHKLENIISTRLVEKNKRIRLAAAKKTIRELEAEKK